MASAACRGSYVGRCFLLLAMRLVAVTSLALIVSVCPARADSVTVKAFNNDNNGTTATVSFNNGGGQITENKLLSQFNVTYSSGSGTVTMNTFTFDLFHEVTPLQTYAVTPRQDLGTAFTNGRQMAYVFQTYGLPDLTNDPDQAAAVQLALWDLSLDNHTPTFFSLGLDGSYSSGDPDVFKVAFGSNPDASHIAALTSQFLTAAIGTTMNGAWLDAAGKGANLMLPVAEPSSDVMTILALGALGFWSLWRCRRG